MLRKRNRPLQKDQQLGHLTMPHSGSETYFQSDFLGHSHKTSSFMGVPGLFVGPSPKGLSDCDSVRSPTSPLDLKVLSNLAKSYDSPRSPPNGNRKSWDFSKVGLSIVDSLDDMKGSNKVLQSSERKNILFGPQVRNRTPKLQGYIECFKAPKSLPRNFAIFPRTHAKSPIQKGNSDVLFEIGEVPLELESFRKIRSCSLGSCRSFSSLSHLVEQNSKGSSGNFQLDNASSQVNYPHQFFGGSPSSNNFSHTNSILTPMSVSSANGFIGSLSASEIELSEDYTCVISHGPNPKKTHIFGDCILDCHFDDFSNFGKNELKEIGLPQAVTSSTIASPFPSNEFLSFCYYCNRKLEEGKDIYIYRGEKAFCSLSCRSQEIMIDEELGESISSVDSSKSDNDEELFEASILDAP